MTTPHSLSQQLSQQLSQMPALSDLFRLFLSGKHLNRVEDPELWAKLERHESAYAELFKELGFDLHVDARGFAWFHSTQASSGIGKISRQLALLFMVIFDTQANAGKALRHFTDWLIDREWLAEAHKQHRDLLEAEGLSTDELINLLGRACTLGFAVAEPAGWRLLPAVFRYLDHFESLAAASRNDDDETDAVSDESVDDALNDEEID